MSRVPWNLGGSPVSIRLRSPDHRAPPGPTDSADWARVRRGASAGAVTIDPAELPAGLDHPGRERGSEASAGLVVGLITLRSVRRVP